MRILLILILLSCTCSSVFAQFVQLEVGAPGTNQFIRDNRFDTSDGGIINVGYTFNAGSGNDVLLVKLNAARTIEWQRTIINAGDDVFYKVIVCANGDYLAIGQMFQGGIRRGVACRVAANTGDILWRVLSGNSVIGEVFFDVVETSNGNFALAGYSSFSPPSTNSFIALLNPDGEMLWSYLGTRPNSDGAQAITQLPNGNLIVGGIYVAGNTHYNLVVLEMAEQTGVVVSQNQYGFLETVPTSGSQLNSFSPNRFYVRNDSLICEAFLYAGFGVANTNCVVSIDLITKNLSGKIFYHTGSSSINGSTAYPLSNDDFIIATSYDSPPEAFISRITNGNVIYDKKISSSPIVLIGIDVQNTAITYSGGISTGDPQGFNMYTTVNFPTTGVQCEIVDVNTLGMQAVSSSPTEEDVLGLVVGGVITVLSTTTQSPGLTINEFCGTLLPVKILNFTATYHQLNKSVIANWQTAQEINIASYIVERSTDGGRSYYAIGTRSPGNNSDYFFTDKNPNTGVIFYRLKYVDHDGKSGYSKIVPVEIPESRNSEYVIAPNPSSGVYMIRTSLTTKRLTDIQVIDVSGRVVKVIRANISADNHLTLDMHSLHRGTYQIRLCAEGRAPVSRKVVLL